MGIIWTIVIGFVAGIVAKFLHPGPNEPSGFNLDDHSRDRRSILGDLYWASTGLVPRNHLQMFD